MLKIEELRIGNLVDYECTTHIVCGLKEDTIESWWFKDGKAVIEWDSKDSSGTLEENPYRDDISNYKPIPLDKKWKKKLKIDGDYILMNSDGDKFYLDDLDYTVEFVHQYQNLIFSLTGKELEIKY